MQKTELLIVFYLLQNKENAGGTLREIAAGSGVSLGSVHSIMAKLTGLGYVIDKGKTKVIRKRHQLIDRWAKDYVENFRAKNMLGRFTFLSSTVREQWNTIILPRTLSWGGESAVAAQYGYIRPARWDVYTADNANPLIATARMIPSPNGEIFVYKRFWQTDGTPPIVVYADLLATNDDRCMEIAERIKTTI
ncbi:MAG: helix-turn-helix domain-containing protein [Bacteroidales bacterium]|nr:helix-turn-helix domain-containing protein [Bacteroidales bacterium]MBR5027673.1 helix-turn-helix domain-containing protein [Bacteroidales bacterium]